MAGWTQMFADGRLFDLEPRTDPTVPPIVVPVEIPPGLHATLMAVAQKHGEEPSVVCAQVMRSWLARVEANQRRKWERQARRAGLARQKR